MVALLLLAAWSLAVAGEARADATSNPALADALFHSAKDHMASGDYPVACAELAESEDLDPQVGTALNLAYCYEHLGRTSTAWSVWQMAAAAATAKGETERAAVASVRAAVLQARLLHVTVAVQAQPARDRIHLAIDHVPLPPEKWGLPVPEDPGDHELLASAEGFRPWRLTCLVTAGAEPTILVPRLEPIAPRDSSAASHSPPVSAVLWATGAAGVATAAIGAGFLIAAEINEHASNSDRRCVQNSCNDTGLAERSRAHDDSLVAPWTLAAGGVVVVASAVTYLVLRSTNQASRRTWASVAPSTAGVALVFGRNW
jgi:hypothetical protein